LAASPKTLRARFCFAGEPSSLGSDTGPSRLASWKTTKPCSRLPRAQFGAGTESLEAHLVEERDIPWADIAFPSTEYALRRYFDDRTKGVENHYFTEFDRRTAELGLSTPG